MVLGSVGREGGFVARRPLPEAGNDALRTPATALADVPAGSVGVLFLDAADDGRALPWPLLRRTLAKDAVVVSLSPFDGALARDADVLVPAPAPLEAWDEVLPTADASAASYAVSAPVLNAPPGATDAIAFLHGLAAALRLDVGTATHEERLRERVAAIHAAHRGRLVARTDGGYAEQETADANALWKALVAGGCWIDEGQAATPLEVRVPMPSPASLERWSQPEAAPGEPEPRGHSRARRGRDDTRLASPHQALPGVGPAPRSHDRGDQPERGRAARSGRPPARADREPERRRPRRAADRPDAAAGTDRPRRGPDPGALHPETSVTARGALPLAVARSRRHLAWTRVRVEEA